MVDGWSGYSETSSYTATFSKTTFVPVFTKTKTLGVIESKKKDILGQRSSIQHRLIQVKVLNWKPSDAPKFISTSYNYGELGHTKPRCHKLLIRNNKKTSLIRLGF